jgi:hypothetical protein
VLTCVRPLVTCRRPVWKFEERVRFNLALKARIHDLVFPIRLLTLRHTLRLTFSQVQDRRRNYLATAGAR